MNLSSRRMCHEAEGGVISGHLMITFLCSTGGAGEGSLLRCFTKEASHDTRTPS